MSTDDRDITVILRDVSRGRAGADALLPVVYAELRALAAERMKNERIDHTLQPTALVHEAYVRLVDQTRVTWRSRAHFFGAAANVIRQILVDSARRKRADKRGSGWNRLELDAAVAGTRDTGPDTTELIAIDDALTELAQVDPRAARVVELRYFGGLSIAHAAEVLDISHATVERDWASARAWLLTRLAPEYGVGTPRGDATGDGAHAVG